MRPAKRGTLDIQTKRILNMDDRFGHDRESAILRSGVREIFTPFKPVTDDALLFGRREEIRRLVSQVNTPGQHSLLYGERGVGKSSLATVVSKHALPTRVRGAADIQLCDSTTTFPRIFEKPLARIGIDLSLKEVESTAGKSNKLGLDKVISAHRDRESGTKSVYRVSDDDISPAYIAQLLIQDVRQGILVVDEADAIRDLGTKLLLATLIKHLSDAASAFKLIIVGISESGSALIGSHPSVARCLKQTRLKRMEEGELGEIIEAGGGKLKLRFGVGATRVIVQCSSGYPYFTHLLALKCAEDAIAEGRRTILEADVFIAMLAAVEDAEDTLRLAYEEACRTRNRDSYRTILAAAATIQGPEFDFWEWREAIQAVTGEPPTREWIGTHVRRLVATDSSRIITRIEKGRYRFTDPRMRSLVLMRSRDKVKHLYRYWQ